MPSIANVWDLRAWERSRERSWIYHAVVTKYVKAFFRTIRQLLLLLMLVLLLLLQPIFRGLLQVRGPPEQHSEDWWCEIIYGPDGLPVSQPTA